MVEEKKEDMVFEVFGKRIEELKEMTENIGKSEESSPKKTDLTKEKKKDESIREKSPEEGLKLAPGIKQTTGTFSFFPEIKENIKKVTTAKHPTIRNFFGLKNKTNTKKEKVVERAAPVENQEILKNLRRLDEKIDKNKEEIYKKLLRESAESKKIIETEREEMKEQMIKLLTESIDNIDSKDNAVKNELYEELQKIKNKFYGEKKQIRNIFLQGSKESKKILESEREKIKEEFLDKIDNLRNKINKEERKIKEGKYDSIEYEPNEEHGNKKHFSLFNRFKRLPEKKHERFNFKAENNEPYEENLEEGDIITNMPEIPRSVDLGLPELPPAKIFVRDMPKRHLSKVKPLSKMEEEANDNEDYQKRIKNILSPEKLSKSDMEFERNMRHAAKKDLKKMEKKYAYEEDRAIKEKKSKKPRQIYVESTEFENARQNIGQTAKIFNNFERVMEETTKNSKKEREKISRILEDAEEIKTSFSKIHSGVLGRVN